MSRLVLTDPIFVPTDPAEGPYYRDCDYCFCSACDDIHAGRRDEADWRQFFLDVDSGACVCEHCLAAYYAEGGA